MLQITLNHLLTISMNWTENGDCFKIVTIKYKSYLNDKNILIIDDYVSFWENNLKVKRGDNNLLFPKLLNSVKFLLSLPHTWKGYLV